MKCTDIVVEVVVENLKACRNADRHDIVGVTMALDLPRFTSIFHEYGIAYYGPTH